MDTTQSQRARSACTGFPYLCLTRRGPCREMRCTSALSARPGMFIKRNECHERSCGRLPHETNNSEKDSSLSTSDQPHPAPFLCVCEICSFVVEEVGVVEYSHKDGYNKRRPAAPFLSTSNVRLPFLPASFLGSLCGAYSHHQAMWDLLFQLSLLVRQSLRSLLDSSRYNTCDTSIHEFHPLPVRLHGP